MYVFYYSCIWIAGIWLGSYLDLPPALGLAGAIPLLALFFTRRYRRQLVMAGAGIIVLVTAAGYSYGSLYGIDEGKVHFYNDRGATEIKGRVGGDPDIRDNSARLTVGAAEIKIEDGWRQVEGKVLVVAPRYPAYQYGDNLRLSGELETPGQAGDFDYRGYLAHQGIYSTMYYPRIEDIEAGRGFSPMGGIYSLRSRLSNVLAAALPEPQAALAQGIVLGIRSNIPADLKNAFSVSGTTHLLAISGMNIGIMAGILLGIGVWLFGRRYYLYVWLALGAVWLYAIITGLNPPVLRGAFMASAFLTAEVLGRQRSGAVTLFLAAAVMAGIWPYVLGDASFQLSFLAMAGLVFIFPVIRGWGRKLVSARLGEDGALVSIANMTVDTWSATLAATIAILPVLGYYFGFVSIIGPLATFIAMPALPVIILAGALTGAIGLVWLTGAQAAGWLAWLFLSYMTLAVKALGAPSLASVEVGQIHPAVIAGYYLLLVFVVRYISRRKESNNPLAGTAGRLRAEVDVTFGLKGKIKWAILPLGLAAVLVVSTAATLPGDGLRVSFLDVGEGDAALIQLGNRQALVDGGPSPQAITLALSREMPFWDRTIDLLVLTHPHQDHLAGLVEVMRRYEVKQVLYADTDYKSPMYDEFMRLIKEKGVKSEAARAGLLIDFGEGVSMKVLNPPEILMTGTESDIDNNSVAVRVSDGAVSFLLTGDMMSEAEWELLRGRMEIASTVVKVAHHGSDTSSTPEFLAAACPRAAVISCGAGNRFGHPFAEILDKLEGKVGAGNLFRTDRQGSVVFTTDGGRLWVKAGR